MSIRHLIETKGYRIYEETEEKFQRQLRIQQLALDNLSLFPDDVFIERDTVGNGPSLWGSGSLVIYIPWNMHLYNSITNAFLRLGWRMVDETKRSPDTTVVGRVFNHPDLIIRVNAWQCERFVVRVRMQAYEDEKKPELQSCHLVQIGVDEVTETKHVPVYDIVCDDSYREMMGDE